MVVLAAEAVVAVVELFPVVELFAVVAVVELFAVVAALAVPADEVAVSAEACGVAA